MDLAFSLLKTLRTEGSIPPDSHLLVAVSGGMDSMALLHLYIRASTALRITISVATFDHGLRGQAGADDARFVAETCAAWGVPCRVGQGTLDPDAPSVEARARDARYAFLANVARDVGAWYVATAHHADDQAETMLLNLIRGTGTRGLGGMRRLAPLPHGGGLQLLRPLLGVRRRDLEAYCRAEGIAWRDDPTNSDTKYRRNWVRHSVIPLLSEANPNFIAAMTRAAVLASEDNEFLDSQLDAVMAQAGVWRRHRVWIQRDVFETWHPALKTRALFRAAAYLGTAEPDFERIKAAQMLSHQPQGGLIELGAGVDVMVDSSYVAIVKHGAHWEPPHEGAWLLPDVPVPAIRAHAAGTAAAPTVTVAAPADAVFALRTRRVGDRVYPAGLSGKSQKLKDWFINRKIPRLIRDYLPLIVVESHILAVWDGAQWQVFAPPFTAKTIEIDLTLG